ncbi:MAG TPA: ABC transporter substrate-binding protein [Longimicrobiales bacterium]
MITHRRRATGPWSRGHLSTLAAALLIALPLFSSAAQAQRNVRPRQGGTLVIAGGSDLQNLNSLVNSESWTTEFINNVLFLPLIRLKSDLTYEPALAQSWRMLGDTGVIFRLRRDVFWHDGRRTSAYDVAFTFNRAKDEATAFPNSDYFDKWQRAQVIDSFTIRFAFQRHVEPLMGWVATAIMPRHLLDSIPPGRLRQAAFNKNPVGNGPFRFVSYRANDRWVFDANPSYPRALGGRPHIDRVIWRIVPDNTAQVTELSTGQADIITAARAEQAKQLRTRPDLRLVLRPNTNYAMIVWNGKRAPLNDARLRRALTMGINRQEMIDVLRAGFAQIATSPVPPFHWAFDRSLPPIPYDTLGARALLRAAGYQDRNRDGIVEDAAGKPLELELKVAANNSFNRDVGELVRASLARIGVGISARPVDFPTMVQDISSPERKFDAAFLQFSTDLRLSFHDAFHSAAIEGPFQSASFRNAELDRLLDRLDVTTDRKKAVPAWHRVQRILRDEQPWTFLWWAPNIIVMRDRVQNATMDVRGALRTLPQWWLSR